MSSPFPIQKSEFNLNRLWVLPSPCSDPIGPPPSLSVCLSPPVVFVEALQHKTRQDVVVVESNVYAAA